jgi:hypothetical protein
MEFKNILTIAGGVALAVILFRLLTKTFRLVPTPPEIIEVEKPKILEF